MYNIGGVRLVGDEEGQRREPLEGVPFYAILEFRRRRFLWRAES